MQLTYFDMPLSTNMLQAYWIDYEVWFEGIFRVEIQGLGKKVCGHAPVHPTQRCAAT
ncbi:hypothetical protein NIB75_19060 [Bacteroides uniformis]|nr:hypothetical protein [Bacteroides uniformis]